MPGLASSNGHGSSTPTAAIQRPSGDQAGRVAPPAASSTIHGRERFDRGPASTSTAQIFVNGARSASSSIAAANATVRPSGCQAIRSTPQSPRVTCRGEPAARPAGPTSSTNRWLQWSRCPISSQRQSALRTRRATGDGSFDERAPAEPIGGRSPTTNRWGSTAHTSASRRPSGDQASSSNEPMPLLAFARRRTPPVRIATAHSSPGASSSTASARTNATVRPSGDTRGHPSRTAPEVSRRGADRPTRSTSHRWRW
jgi:hypothetical protein